MTGFGEASLQVGGPSGAHWNLEVRSLNSKYFKAIIRLPEQFQMLEAELEAELRHRLTRGSVFMTVRYSDASENVAYTINARALTRYLDQLKQVAAIGSGALAPDLGAMLALPGVLQPPTDEDQRLASARETLAKLLDKACAGLIQMREREGAMLLTDLHTHRDVMATRLKQVAARSPQFSTDYEKRLRTRIDQMVKELGLKVEPVDIIREIAVAAERSDINEEIARLGGHIEQFTEMLAANDHKPLGRTLDFLTQEMLREANTIASKCGDAEISKWTVEIKSAIDRIKEQVQNVE